jgi:NAD(P)-dependent dehydrogenase (short-subunit alcohol dehydrogenase family)
MKLEGHTFLITGGASGLGAACAEMFAGAGANVILADVAADNGNALAAKIGGRARFAKVDVTSEADITAAVQMALKDFGGLHGAINCAGIAIARKLISKKGQHDTESFLKVLTINVVGTFNVCKIAAEQMGQQEPVTADGERGVLINTASVAAFDGQIGQVAYSASKGAIVGMMLPIARELAESGIRLVTIAPGIFKTPMMAGLPEAAQKSLGEQVPFPSRLGDPSEYAALARHIVENSMLNGEVIRLDGAIRMAPR